MEEREKRLIGEQLEPGGRPKAPGRLELLQRFVNTHNHDFPGDWDRIGTAEKAEAWLREKGLVAADDRVSDADAARLRALREAIRALLVAHQGRGGGGHHPGGHPAALSSTSSSSRRGGPSSKRPQAVSTVQWRRSWASSTRPS